MSVSAAGDDVLVVAAHPDDDVIAMAGTIARHTAEGDRVHVAFMSDGVGARFGANAADRTQRVDAALRACEILGAKLLDVGGLPDNQFDTTPLLDAVRLVEQYKATVGPVMVYTHHPSDLNVDHRVTCQATVTAFRPQPHESFREIRLFEVSSSTEWAVGGRPFTPDTFIDVSAYLDLATRAYACYESEVRADPSPRSLEAVAMRARHRGRQVGLEAADAFETHRRIMR